MSADNDTSGYQLPEVDRLIHEPARYNIMALLFVVERAEFLFVQNQTQMTPGNLSSHLSKLEAAEYLTIQKEFIGKMPKTFLSLTEQGREAFKSYRDKMKDLFTALPRVRTDSDGK
jgi:DNA-binding MarR family transcriptional regulator